MDEAMVLQLPLVIASFGISAWGWKVVPPGTRFPMRFGGASGFESTVGKTTALLTYPALSVMVMLGSSIAGAAESPAVGLLGSLALIVLLIGQISAIKRAAGPPSLR